jgi:hypothetical protein
VRLGRIGTLLPVLRRLRCGSGVPCGCAVDELDPTMRLTSLENDDAGRHVTSLSDE